MKTFNIWIYYILLPMLNVTKNNFEKNQSVLSSRKNLDENRILRRSYLRRIIILMNLNCMNEMLLKKKTAVLSVFSYTKDRKSPVLLSSTGGSTSFLNKRNASIINSRSMMSRRVIARSINSLNNVPQTTIAHYATRRVCNGEKYPVDPKALKNNPNVPLKNNKYIRHPEIRRQECTEDIDCKEKSCPTLCSPAKGPEKATGHLTHGTPSNPYATTVEKLDSVDAQGKAKDQHAVFYGDAHNTGSAVTENVQATSYINQPHIVNKIITHEDKK